MLCMTPRTFLLVLFFLPLILNAQHYQGVQADKLIPGSESIRTSTRTGALSYVRFRPDVHYTLDQWKQETPAWIPAHAAPANLKPIRSDVDMLGMEHHRFQLLHEGFPVEGAILIVHEKNGEIRSVNGDLYSVSKRATGTNRINLSAEQALEKALQKVNATTYMWELPPGLMEEKIPKPEGELVYAPAKGDFTHQPAFRLCWKFDVFAAEPLYRAWIYVDAASGEILWEANQLHSSDVTGSANTRYSGMQTLTTDSVQPNQFRLRQAGRNITTLDMQRTFDFSTALDFLDLDNYWNNFNPNQDEVAADVHFGTEKMYDHLLNDFGWNSYDNLGAPLTSYVHYGNQFQNAFWTGSYMVYGDGDSTSVMTSPLTTLDICGHEILHGVTQFSSGLLYIDESGAINESFSDIFGTVLEAYVRPTSWNWICGEQTTPNGAGIRNMADPKIHNHPDTYLGQHWYTGPYDNGGVHTNSGVQNKWFYILTQGEAGTNDNNSAYNVTGIGLQKAAQIAFRNNTVYLTPGSQFTDARFYAIESARDLFGDCSVEVIQTTNAWYAVGVDSAYVPNPQANFTALQTNYCELPADVAFTNQSSSAGAYLWDFGDGSTDTTSDPIHTYNNWGTYTIKLYATGCTGGLDSLIQTNYITLDSSIACPWTMGASGWDTVSRCLGVLKDPGSPGYYPNNAHSFTTIAPPDAATITYDFSNIEMQSYIDYLYLYDGPNNQAPLIGIYNRYFPVLPGPVTTTGGVLTAEFFSDSVIAYTGFDMNWSCTPSTSAPTAGLAGTPTRSCDGYVQFINSSTGGATSNFWDFGDGNTSSDYNPDHTYSNPGTYTVTLISCNNFGCDTITRTNYIEMDPGMGCAAVLPPWGTDYYTECEGQLFDPGGNANYPVNTSSFATISVPGALHVVLDFKAFALHSSDRVFIYDGPDPQTSPSLGSFTGTNLPNGGQIASSDSSITIGLSSNMQDVDSGFVLDWHCLMPSDPPISIFSADPLTTCSGIVEFTDQSIGVPYSWFWDFGDGTTDTTQNPTHTYTQNGDYDITLITCNASGCDTLVRQAYITMDSLAVCTYTMDSAGTEVIPLCNGRLLDPGGIGGYPTNCASIVTIAPPNAASITLNFSLFNTAGPGDYLNIYDGPDTNSILIGRYLGFNLPNGGTITSTQSSLTLEFRSDNQYIRPGFDLVWSCTPISGPPVTDFAPMQTLTCTGYASFRDSSQGGVDSWLWDFGDGNTDTLRNPVHLYTVPGTYTVSLITCNPMGCDTLIRTNLITYDPTATCTYTMQSFHQVIQDCQGTLLDPGGTGNYPLNTYSTVTIQPPGADSLALFFNSFAIFWPGDLTIYDGPTVFSPWIGSFSQNTLPATPIITSGGAVTLEFSSGSGPNVNTGFEMEWFCLQSNAPPIPLFSASPRLSCDGIVSFTDESLGNPTSWFWDFGDGVSSTQQNPSHQYMVNGIFDVTLIVCNASGCDTLLLPNYIEVDQYASCPVNMPGSGWDTLQTCQGTLRDPGGTGDYFNNHNTLVTIAPVNAATVTLNFNSFHTQTSVDNLVIYDGPNTTSPGIGNYSGSSLPNGGTVTSTGPSITLRFVSNASLEYSGFELTWSCTAGPPPPPPTAAFSGTPTPSCNGYVAFTDQSSQNPTFWTWDFGDGTTSAVQHPTHLYTASGTYTVTLITCNISGCDTLEQTNFVEVDLHSLACEEVTLAPADTVYQYRCRGRVLDDGGSGNYSSDLNTSMIIAPPGAEGLSLRFTDFALDSPEIPC